MEIPIYISTLNVTQSTRLTINLFWAAFQSPREMKKKNHEGVSVI